MKHGREFAGECIGTFLMIFFGVGSVAVTVLFGAHMGTLQIGLVWGVAIALAIYTTRNLSCAHFNPAVSVGMVVGGRMSVKLLPIYFLGQFTGAFAAAGALYGLLGSSMLAKEAELGVTRNTASSVSSIFCEVYPNTAAAVVPTGVAFAAEALGVFLLVLLIFSLTEGCNTGRPSEALAPLFIGLTITCLIAVIGPLTNAGLNPARDLAPRLVGWLAGWQTIAFSWSTILVYTVGPLVGGALAPLVFTRVIEPLMQKQSACESGLCDETGAAIEQTVTDVPSTSTSPASAPSANTVSAIK